MEIHAATTFIQHQQHLGREGSSRHSFRPNADETGGDSVQQSRLASSATPGKGQQEDLAELRLLEQLRARDREVRAHELAHAAAAGGLSKGGPSFEYQRGPDGQLYAVAGEVQIDTSSVSGDPEATLEKAIQIQQAALAPAQPSSQDRSVAMAAAAMAAQARAEINSQASDKIKDADADAHSPLFISHAHDAYRGVSEINSSRNLALVNQTA